MPMISVSQACFKCQCAAPEGATKPVWKDVTYFMRARASEDIKDAVITMI